MGCACAWILARHGARITVLERSVPGAEASSAAAGIIGTAAEAHGPGPMTELMLASQRRHADWASELQSATGIDVGLRSCGILRVVLDGRAASALKKAVAWHRSAGLETAWLDSKDAARLEPALRKVAGSAYHPEDGRIDPPLFLRALHIAAQRAGAAFRTGTYVRSVSVDKGSAAGVLLDDGSRLEAGAVVIAAGSWTTLIGGTSLAGDAVVPARGQIVELASPSPVIEHVVFGPRCYLVPRDDGRTLVGSTLEFVGYRREVTALAVRDLLDAAIDLVPALGAAQVRSSWSNFRPYTQDELPIVGATAVRRLFLATGHYRNGILLAPATAEAIAALVAGKKPPVSVEAFGPLRG
jgi:glycine oxidase